MQVKTNTDALGAAPDIQLHPEVCKQMSLSLSSGPGKGIMFALLMLDLKYY